MDEFDRRIVNALQGGFPISERPFAEAGATLGLGEAELIARIGAMLESGALSRFAPMLNAEKMDGAVTLAAMRVPEPRFDEVTALVNAHPEIAHNYQRDHELNMWFVVAAEHPHRVREVLAEIVAETGLDVYDMPKETEYFLSLRFTL